MNIQRSTISNFNYQDLVLPENSIIYFDPPYANTTKYNGTNKFNHDEFWDWVRTASEKHDVFVSEYNAQNDFKCIWQGELSSTLSTNGNVKKAMEKLFKYNYK